MARAMLISTIPLQLGIRAFHRIFPQRNMPPPMSITFLGTASGGGPIESRNSSSLVCDLLANGTLWMVDCAEGTLRQFACQPKRGPWLKASQISKLFVTHMHADHVMGIVPLIRSILLPPSVGANPLPGPSQHLPKIEIYGPAGIRIFVRSIMTMTLTKTAAKYAVHELLTQQDDITPCTPDVLHSSELPGQDIRCAADSGHWRAVTSARGAYSDVVVDAGPIAHRDPCIGYVFHEPSYPMRKVVILGDTHDPSSITPLCISPSPSLLIHEATDAYIPQDIDYRAKRSVEVVKEKALARGHSTPDMAGAFAKSIGAEMLVLNHIGTRFPAPHGPRDFRVRIMREIERQASEAWGMGQACAAWDYMNIVIPVPTVTTNDASQQYKRPSRHRDSNSVDVDHSLKRRRSEREGQDS